MVEQLDLESSSGNNKFERNSLVSKIQIFKFDNIKRIVNNSKQKELLF